MDKIHVEARLNVTDDRRGRTLVHDEKGQIGWAFYSKFFGDVIISAAQRKGIISMETAQTLLCELNETNLPRNPTQEDRESMKKPDAKPI